MAINTRNGSGESYKWERELVEWEIIYGKVHMKLQSSGSLNMPTVAVNFVQSAKRERERERERWCFEPSQPQRIRSELKTDFNLFPSYSFHKSLYHKSLFLKPRLKSSLQFHNANSEEEKKKCFETQRERERESGLFMPKENVTQKNTPFSTYLFSP